MRLARFCLTLTASALALSAGTASAAFINAHPKVEGSDFYMFRSYEAGRADFVTILADYQPDQSPYGGPAYYPLEPNGLYEIMIDKNGDGVEDITFQFRFTNAYSNNKIAVGDQMVPVPLLNTGAFGPGVSSGDASKNLIETYTLTVVAGDRRTGVAQQVPNTAGGFDFRKPLDNIGNKSIANYATYARNHIFPITVPGCTAGKVFVGQRQDPFFVNLGELFDLANFNPVGSPNAKPNALESRNVTTLALELPIACLTATGNPIIGAWTSASLRQATVLNPHPTGVLSGATSAVGPEVAGGSWSQVSRVGNPLVSALVIGVPDRDRFNASEPVNDSQFLTYITNPSLPALLQQQFNLGAPATFPRNDLVSVYLTGIDGLNKPAGVVQSEMLRLNTSTAVTAAAQQSNLGVLADDDAGFPNGRRPGDDVVDITLRLAMGAMLPAAQAPSGQLPFTDQTTRTALDFDQVFPYAKVALPGSPAPTIGTTTSGITSGGTTTGSPAANGGQKGD